MRAFPLPVAMVVLAGVASAQGQLQITPGWGLVTDPLAQAITPPPQPPDLAPGPLAVPPGLAPPAPPPDQALFDTSPDLDPLESAPEMPRRAIPF